MNTGGKSPVRDEVVEQVVSQPEISARFAGCAEGRRVRWFADCPSFDDRFNKRPVALLDLIAFVRFHVQHEILALNRNIVAGTMRYLS